MKSTAGSRLLARERDLAEGRVADSDVPPVIHPPSRGPLAERLSLESLRAIAGLFGWTLSDIEERYKWAR